MSSPTKPVRSTVVDPDIRQKKRSSRRLIPRPHLGKSRTRHCFRVADVKFLIIGNVDMPSLLTLEWTCGRHAARTAPIAVTTKLGADGSLTSGASAVADLEISCTLYKASKAGEFEGKASNLTLRGDEGKKAKGKPLGVSSIDLGGLATRSTAERVSLPFLDGAIQVVLTLSAALASASRQNSHRAEDHDDTTDAGMSSTASLTAPPSESSQLPSPREETHPREESQPGSPAAVAAALAEASANPTAPEPSPPSAWARLASANAESPSGSQAPFLPLSALVGSSAALTSTDVAEATAAARGLQSTAAHTVHVAVEQSAAARPVVFMATYMLARKEAGSTVTSAQTISWRYHHWRELHLHLVQQLPAIVRPLRFPPKGYHIFRPGPSSAFVQQRRDELERYIFDFVASCGAEYLHAAIAAIDKDLRTPSPC